MPNRSMHRQYTATPEEVERYACDGVVVSGVSSRPTRYDLRDSVEWNLKNPGPPRAQPGRMILVVSSKTFAAGIVCRAWSPHLQLSLARSRCSADEKQNRQALPRSPPGKRAEQDSRHRFTRISHTTMWKGGDSLDPSGSCSPGIDVEFVPGLKGRGMPRTFHGAGQVVSELFRSHHHCRGNRPGILGWWQQTLK